MIDPSDIKLPCKALTLWQPWASLLACGIKTIETRGWETSHRGPVMIHAASKWNGELQRFSSSMPMILLQHRFDKSRMTQDQADLYGKRLEDTLGRVLCVADLVDCRRMDAAPNGIEGAFGCFGPGRYGWRFENVRILSEFVPLRGMQKLFTVKSFTPTPEPRTPRQSSRQSTDCSLR